MVSDKSMVLSSVHTHFVGYFDAVNSDDCFQRRELLARILAKGLHFPMLLKCKFNFH